MTNSPPSMTMYGSSASPSRVGNGTTLPPLRLRRRPAACRDDSSVVLLEVVASRVGLKDGFNLVRAPARRNKKTERVKTKRSEPYGLAFATAPATKPPG